FDVLVQMDAVDAVADEDVQKGLDAARERQQKLDVSIHDRLRAIVYGRGGEDQSGELSAIIEELDLDEQQDGNVRLLYTARSRYPRAVADGLLRRLRAGRELFYGADELLATGRFSLEDNTLLEIALSGDRLRDARAEAAASVLG